MKQLIKNNLKVLIAIILTAIICIGGSVYATIRMQADEIGYKDGTVEDALNNLYSLAGNVNLSKYAELRSSYVSNKDTASVTFNDVAEGDYVLLTVRTTEARESNRETGFFNSSISGITTSISLNGTSNEIDEDALYIVHANAVSNITVTSSTLFEANTAGGYLYARLYKIN